MNVIVFNESNFSFVQSKDGPYQIVNFMINIFYFFFAPGIMQHGKGRNKINDSMELLASWSNGWKGGIGYAVILPTF